MLHSARLENFGPHKLFEQEFGSGLTMILGPNGCGKSNILYGVGWTIHGHKALPPEYKQSDIIRDGEKCASGEVVIDLLGLPHTFSRTYDGKNVQASVYRDGEEVATGARGVEEFLAMYGITWQSASVLFSRQRELDSFVYATPAERKSIFESLLQVESVNDARKIARQRQKDCTSDPDPILAEHTIKEIQELIKHWDGEVAKQSNFKEECKVTLGASETLRRDALDVLTAASADDAARRFQGLIRLANDKKSKAHRRLDQIEPTIKSAPVLNDAQVVKSQAFVAEAEKGIILARKDLYTKEHEMADQRDVKSSLLTKLDLLEKTIRDLKDGKCPLCKTEISDPEVHAAAMHDLSRGDLGDLLDDNHTAMTIISGEIDELQMKIDELEAQRLSTSTELDQFNYALSLVPEAMEVRAELKKLDGEIAEHENEIAGLTGPTPEQTQAFKDADEKLDDDKACLRTCQQNLDHAVEQANKMTATKEQFEEATIQYATNEGDRKLYAQVTKALDQFRNQVLQSALNWVSLRATEAVRMIGTLPDSGPDVQLSLDKDLQFWFTSGGKDTPVYRFSGGQKAVFAICLRMALSEYFSDRLGLKGFLLLDAVLDSLTPENQDATAAALQASGPQQAIIFSHFDVEGLEAHRVRL